MKKFRAFTGALCAVFVSVCTALWFAGPAIRAAISPRVEIVYPEYADVGGKYCLTLPSEAIIRTEEGAYVALAAPSERCPEPGYDVTLTRVEPFSEENGVTAVISGLSPGDIVILPPFPEEGRRVIPQ